MAGCGHCVNVKNFLREAEIPFNEVNVSNVPEARALLIERGHTGVPQVYLDGELFVKHHRELHELGVSGIRDRLDEHCGDVCTI